MATPRKPGAKRGRPPRPKNQPASERSPFAPKLGRKARDIRNDPGRYHIAMSDALLMLGAVESENSAVKAVAVRVIGREVQPSLQAAERAAERGRIATAWEKIVAPGVAASFDGYATTLRAKRSRYRDQKSLAWRQAMGRALMFALDKSLSVEASKTAARAFAQSVGEREFFETTIATMIDNRD